MAGDPTGMPEEVGARRSAIEAPGVIPFLALEAYHYIDGVRPPSHRRVIAPRYAGLGAVLAVVVLLLL